LVNDQSPDERRPSFAYIAPTANVTIFLMSFVLTSLTVDHPPVYINASPIRLTVVAFVNEMVLVHG